MAYTGSARLEADGLDPFVLTIENGIAVDLLDVGFPAIRAVANSNPDRDGEDDRTRYIGARAVTITGTIVPAGDLTRQGVLDRLGAFLVPTRRPYLIYELEDGSGERRIRLRIDQHARPIIRPGSLRVAVGWRGPDGIQESAVVIEVEGEDAGDQNLGRSYDLDFDRDYPHLTPAGDVEIDNTGNLPVAPTLIMYGPATSPRVVNMNSGLTLEVDGVVLPLVTDFVTVDVGARTAIATVDGIETDVTDLVPPETSAWWSLDPGVSTVRYRAGTYEQGAHLTVRARPAWI